MGYWIFYIMMLVGYAGVSLQTSDLKMKAIGIFLIAVNALLFWR